MWLYVLTIVGVLGVISLAWAVLSRFRSKSPSKTRATQPLVHVTQPCWYETPPDPSKGAWSQRITGEHRSTLAQDTRFLCHITHILNSISSLDNALEHVIKELTRHLAVDLAQLFLLDDAGMLQLTVSVGVPMPHHSLPNWAFTLPDLVLATDKPMLTSDLRLWPQLRSFVSASELASALWLPLKAGGSAVGTLGLGCRQTDAFDQDTIAIVTTVASYLATAVENSRLRQQVIQEKELRQSLQRYVSPRLVTTFQQDPAPHPQEIIDTSLRMSVLFADVRSFTPLMERADPDAVMRVLNEYFLRMSQIIQNNGGVVDEFAGDQIVASFDRTSPRVNDAVRAVRAGVEMLAGLKTLQQRWRQRSLPIFDIGIGISTGAVTRGSVGSKERRAIIALGSILNIASRAEEMNKKFGTRLIITQSTFEQTANLIEYDALGAHQLQGISQPVPLYSVRGLKNNHHSGTRSFYDTTGIAQVTQRRQALAEQTSSSAGAGLRP